MMMNIRQGMPMFEIRKEEYVNKTFRLKKALVEELAKCAAENRVSMNALIAQCCRYALSNMKCRKNENVQK